MRTRFVLALLRTIICLFVSVWFMRGYIDLAFYAFSDPRDPLPIGDVVESEPAALLHNDYVALHGIIEHRGLTQTYMRDIDISLQHYWYFRLLGSRGVFIETPQDANRYSFAREVAVVGRVVDPQRATFAYQHLLQTYETQFATSNQPVLRMIQVDLKPGMHRLRYALAYGLVMLLNAANIYVVCRYYKKFTHASASAVSSRC